MAKQNQLIQFDGTIDGLSFYTSKYGRIVRRKGGPNPKKMKTDANFARVRENGKEFGRCGKAAGFLRRALAIDLRVSGDHLVAGRLTQLFMKIKKCDTLSDRGQRNPATALKSAEGKALLNHFDFNSEAPLGKVLLVKYHLDQATGAITVPDFDPKQDLKKPKGASHVRITATWLRLDFGSGKDESFKSNAAELSLNSAPFELQLLPDGVPGNSGTDIYVLQICFFQEINGIRYSLANEIHNSLSVVGVA